MSRFRTACLALAVVLAPALPLSAQIPDFSSLMNSVSTLADKAGEALPSASSMGLDWSDAWIGSLVGIPPHFGLGLSTGFTTIPTDALQPLFNAMGNALPSYATALGGVPLPMYTVNARIGGFLLPFDVGLKLGYMPTMTVSNLGLNYLMAGGDIRYALLQDGITPGLSLGFGVNYIQANLSYAFSSPSFTVSGTSYTGTGNSVLQIANPTASLGLQSLSYELKAEVSKNLLIVTPYAGAAVSLSSINVNAAFNGTLEDSSGAVLTPTEINQLSALSGVNFSSNGITQGLSKTGIYGFRLWGGTSINIVLFKIDLKAFYTLPSGNLGAELGARFQM
ncbi:MAG: hypothetical protein HKM06_04480 [Spirochaetales bacterium]|nr:hypothetical protein [Spirochaetales bacterium]